jgi:hypothetical protein
MATDLKSLEEQVDMLSTAVVEAGETVSKSSEELEKLKVKFNSFCLAILKNMPKETSDTIFKDYQKNIFNAGQ